MGNSVSHLSSRKYSSSSSSSSSCAERGKRPSLFQRSKSTLNFRKRSKSQLAIEGGVWSNPSSSSNLQVVPNRQISIDSTSDELSSAHSQRSCDSNQSFPRNSASLVTPQNQNDISTILPTGTPGGSLPDWAVHGGWCKDGRRRHMVESAPYMLPNDLTESDRLDAQHYLVRFVFKGNFNVTLDPEANIRILDVATGTGVWALEMAHEFPKAEVYGVDISAIFPAEIKPKNCHFQLCNILDGLPFPDNHFDFIYQRLLVYALTPAQRREVNVELMRVLKPEGYLQLVESDGIVYNPGPEMEKINQLSLETSLRHGVDPREVQTMRSGLKHAGYAGVNSFTMALPVGEWGGKAGSLSTQNMHGLATIWLKGEVGRHSQEECDVILKIVDEECERLQSYYKVWLVVGQKPSVAQTQLKEAKRQAAAYMAAQHQSQLHPNQQHQSLQVHHQRQPLQGSPPSGTSMIPPPQSMSAA